MFTFLTKPTRATYCLFSGGWREDVPLPLEVCWNFKELNVGVDSARLRGAVNALSVREKATMKGWSQPVQTEVIWSTWAGFLAFFFFTWDVCSLFRSGKDERLAALPSVYEFSEGCSGNIRGCVCNKQKPQPGTYYDFILLTSPKTNMCNVVHFQVMRGGKKCHHAE